MKRSSAFVRLIFPAVILCTGGIAVAQGTRVLREPDIFAEQIVFTYAGDIWISKLDGSDVRRITSFPGVESAPHFSPDGQTIAFSGQYDGNTDVFMVPASGGSPKRLTWHPGDDMVTGWTPDGKHVLFRSGRTRVPYQIPDQLWMASVRGTTPERFTVPRGVNGKFSPDGTLFVFEKNYRWDPEFRNYRGGQNTPLRIIDLSTYEVEKLPWKNSTDRDPVWIGDHIYFLSDRDFAMNIWRYDVVSKELSQITTYNTFDCKNLEEGDGKMVFENGGYLYVLEPGKEKPAKLTVTVRADFPWSRPHWVRADKYMESITISPEGKRVAFSARGEIITVPLDKGDARNLTGSPGVADREVAWSSDGQHISWFSDETGEYQMMISDQYGNEKKHIPIADPTFYYEPAWSPDSKYLCFYNENRTLWILDVDAEKFTRIDNEGFAHPEHVIYGEWSPDSKWLAYARRLSNQYAAIFVYSAEQDKSFQITDGLSHCRTPAWDASGKYLYFTASTNYGLNVGWLDMSSFERPVKSNIYIAVLSKDEISPLAPESDEAGTGKKEPDAGDREESGEKEKAPEVTIDFEGLQERITALPVPVGKYEQLETGEKGELYYSEEQSGRTGRMLHRFILEKNKTRQLADSLTTFRVSSGRKKVLYKTTGNRLIVIEQYSEGRIKKKLLKTEDIKIRIDPLAEWKQIFREAWRFQRDYFYVENVHGLDLDWAYETYRPWVDHVRHRSDLTCILDILGGETSIGHSFVRGGDFPDVEKVPVGLLGADFIVENNRFRISKIYDGKSWNPDVEAPLGVAGLDIGVGDYLVGVNGEELDASVNLYSAFDHLAGRQIFIHVNSEPTMEGSGKHTVVPVGNDGSLRQYDWVEENRRKVDGLSGGKLAYVWLPNTSIAGYNYFNRYYFAQKDKKGAVIDERFNQGGSIADYIVDLLDRELLGYFNNPIGEKQPFTAPNAGIWGPKVMVINEMAGSGGDMLPYMFRKKEIGPLVGTRTWGGLVGIWDVPKLIDGGIMTAPRGGFYNLEGEWDVENEGVAPDIRVEQDAKSVIRGHDPQLEKAVEVAMDLLEKEKIILKPQPEDPVRVMRPQD